jgi:hypothetical protein
MRKSGVIVSLAVALLVVAGFIGCGKQKASTSNAAASSIQQQGGSASTEKPVAPEKNPPGDIPDNQAFVKYVSSQGGYELEAPEGWARTESGRNVRFVYKLDGLSVGITRATRQPTSSDIRNHRAGQIVKTGRAVDIKSIEDVRISNSPAVHMTYESNSDLDPVTNKQVRLGNDVYYFYKNGSLAELRLWAPLGADNVDQWKRISRSFTWR